MSLGSICGLVIAACVFGSVDWLTPSVITATFFLTSCVVIPVELTCLSQFREQLLHTLVVVPLTFVAWGICTYVVMLHGFGAM